MKKVIFRIMFFLLVAVMSLTVVKKMSVGYLIYSIQMDNKKYAQETAYRNGGGTPKWTDELKSQVDEAEKVILTSQNPTVQVCRRFTKMPVAIVLLFFSIIFMYSIYMVLKDTKKILKRRKKKKCRM